MRVFERVRTGSVVCYQCLPLSSQTFCEAEDVLKLMQRHVGVDGSVDTLYIEFENMRVPVCHVSELRVVAQLAAAYNNSIIAENLKHEKDVHGHAYTPEVALRKDIEPAKQQSKTSTRKKQKTDSWDEEMHGDRFVYDTQYEQNEELLPWRLKENEERYGWYD